MKDIVTFKVAKIAKEKGFNEKCLGDYDEQGLFEFDVTQRLPDADNTIGGFYAAPTWRALIDWIFDSYVDEKHEYNKSVSMEFKIMWLGFWNNTFRSGDYPISFFEKLEEWFVDNGILFEYRTSKTSDDEIQHLYSFKRLTLTSTCKNTARLIFTDKLLKYMRYNSQS